MGAPAGSVDEKRFRIHSSDLVLGAVSIVLNKVWSSSVSVGGCGSDDKYIMTGNEIESRVNYKKVILPREMNHYLVKCGPTRKLLHS
jgi:hypothetical protein